MTVTTRAMLGCLAVVAAVSGSTVAAEAFGGPSKKVCESRANDTAAKLVECIQEKRLWRHLVALQRISDNNKGPDGHGNRDTGQPGYKASVDYVAGLMRQAGYHVAIQRYNYTGFTLKGAPLLRSGAHDYKQDADFIVARLSGQGTVKAPVQPVGIGATSASFSRSGCSSSDFAGFVPGHIALIERGGCALDTKVTNAQAAKAAAVILFNVKDSAEQVSRKGSAPRSIAYRAYLQNVVSIPVIVTSYAVGADLMRHSGKDAPSAFVDVQAKYNPGKVDYNLIADSRFGDAKHVVVVEGHLDSIYGAGILDNGSGSATILEIALNLANTPTQNQLRYIWFGGEEIGLLGSKYYTQTLDKAALKRIVFDLDADVTATPNYATLVANPKYAFNADRFPPNVIPDSRVGNKLFFDYFHKAKLPIRNASFGNAGTDSNAFSIAGVPNSGILTQQDCCKSAEEVAIWGGFRGNYEGNIPSHDGGCVDNKHRWCDNLDNNLGYVLEFVSKGFAYVTFNLANDAKLGR